MANSSDQQTVSIPDFVDYLKQLQRKGHSHVNIDDQAKLILREFYIRAKGGQSQLAAKKTPQTAPSVQTKAPAQTPASDRKKLSPQPVSTIIPSGNNAAEQIASLRNQAQSSPTIKQLGTLRDTLVFSSGNPNAEIMFIGEHPGYHEEKNETPFSGPAGKKLDNILKAMGLTREEVYLSYVVKYRPLMENQTTGNRTPTQEEISANAPFLTQEIKVVSPKVIVTLGSVAAQHLLATTKNIEDLRGKQHAITNIPLIVTHHPSYLIYNENNQDKRMIWEDMLATMKLVNLPISEKQMNYFK